MNRALLQQALDALEQCTYDEEGYLLNPDNEGVIEALKAELAKPEPVAWLSTDCTGERYMCFTKPTELYHST